MASVRSIALLLAALSVSVEWTAAYGRFDIRGRVLCKGKPYEGAQMAFYEFDTFEPNDLCFVTTSGKDGTFAAHGVDDERGTADHIVLNIRHSCIRPNTCTEVSIPAEYWQLDESDPDYKKPRSFPDISIDDAALKCQAYELKDFDLKPDGKCDSRGLIHLLGRFG